MSLTVTITSLAVLATLAAAFLQPMVSHWLTPKQKLRLDIATSKYEIPPAVSREMSKYYYSLRAHTQPTPEFGEFLKFADDVRTYFDVAVTNTGKTISRNVVLGCTAQSKYVLIRSRNKLEYHPDQPEYFLGDLQPSEKIERQILSTSYFPTYDFAVLKLFSVRDDHNSPKQIVLRRIYDKTSHYLIEKAFVENLFSAIKWGVAPPLVILIVVYLIITIIHQLWPATR